MAPAIPAPALATPAQVIADCNSHGRLTRGYPVSELRTALTTMPADVKEYTDCNDVIERALLAQLGGSHARHAAGGASRAGSSSGGSFLPAPLVVVLVLLALAAVALGGVALRRRRHA
ncbi:MAG: hypothetical protein DLM64_04435 [Solirubrobacterales bacterium]|nr:MAG: hypothetical protein DLM64_04435 [Solirubrobacterales bacterium]